MATKKPNTDEIASIEKDIFGDYLAFGNVIQNPDKVIRSEGGGKGIELFEDLLRDAQVAADLDTRRKAVIGREWDVVPATEKKSDTKIAEYVKQVLTNCGHDSARKSLLSGLVLGYKPAEIMWDYSEGDVFVKEIIPRSARRFVFGKDRGLRLLTPSNMVEGEAVPDKKFQLFVTPCDNGSPYGQGLGRALYWPVWFKKNGIKFWMIFSDKFGSPTAVGKYPPGTSKEHQDALLEACEAIQQESAIKIPNTLDIGLLEAGRTSSVNNYETLCLFMDGQITKLILGHSGASQSTAGKLGGEDRAQDVQDKNLKYDADLLCEQENNQLVKWIVDYNFPGVKQYPKLWIRTEEEEDLKPQAERDQLLIQMGLPIAERYFYDTYGEDMKPEGDEAVVKPTPPPSPFGMGADPSAPPLAKGRLGGVGGDGSFSECGCGRKHPHPSGGEGGVRGGSFDFAEDVQWVAEYMKRLEPSLRGAKQSALNEIEQWLAAQTSPPSAAEFNAKIQQILGQAYESMDKQAVNDAVADMYRYYKTSLPIANVSTTFGGADSRAIEWLAQNDNQFFSKFIKNPESQDALTRFLSERYLEGGEGLFGRGDPKVIAELKDLLSQKLTDISGFQANRIVDTSVQRIRNFSHISKLADAGIAEVEVYEPTEECAFCAAMNGKVIQVDTAYGLMQDILNMTSDEYVEHLQATPPTLDNLAALQSSGALPPYHPFCHGRTIMRMKKMILL